MGIGTGYGKLILFGEHAAVYGYPAIGVRLDEALTVSVSATPDGSWELPQIDGAELVRAAYERAASLLGIAPEPSRITITGTLPMSVGFGSSAAFCTGLLHALAPDSFPRDQLMALWKTAHDLEHIFHGTPSGIDTGLSIFPGTHAIVPSPPGLPVITPIHLPDGWLVIGAVPRTTSTAILVAGVRELQEADPDETRGVMRDLGSIAQAVIDDGSGSGVDELGSRATEAHRLLSRLGISNPATDDAIAMLAECGATGAKLSGAGGGGAFFGIFPERKTAIAAAVKLQQWLNNNNLAVGSPGLVSVLPLRV